jgi:hypothetical protein
LPRNDKICLARKNAPAGTIYDSLPGPGTRENEHLPGGIRGWVSSDDEPELCDEMGDDAEKIIKAEFKKVATDDTYFQGLLL